MAIIATRASELMPELFLAELRHLVEDECLVDSVHIGECFTFTYRPHIWVDGDRFVAPPGVDERYIEAALPSPFMQSLYGERLAYLREIAQRVRDEIEPRIWLDSMAGEQPTFAAVRF